MSKKTFGLKTKLSINSVAVKEKRLQYDWSQQRCADILGITLKTYLKYENGYLPKNAYVTHHMMTLFDLEPKEFFVFHFPPLNEGNKRKVESLLESYKYLKILENETEGA